MYLVASEPIRLSGVSACRVYDMGWPLSFYPTSKIENASLSSVGRVRVGCWISLSPRFFLKTLKSSNRALKRLKKSTTSDGNDSDNGGLDTDRSNANSERSRKEHEEEVGNRSSAGRRSGEVGYKNADYVTSSTNDGSRRHAASPSSGASGNYHNSKSNGSSSSRRKDWESKGSSSRSPSPSPSSLFDRLKSNWGRESWQDFELLQNNVPGPGTKGYGGPGASHGTLGKSECPTIVGLAFLCPSSLSKYVQYNTRKQMLAPRSEPLLVG